MNLSLKGIAVRFVFALLLVLLTYNPSGYSYLHWVSKSLSTITPYLVIAGLVLLAGWVVYLHATFSSLGFWGVALSTAFLSCLIWLLIYWQVFSLHNTPALTWVAEMALAALLTLGMCWSHLWRRMSGQVDVEETENL